MKVAIVTVAISGWYPKGVARMIQEFERVSPGFEIRAWVNHYPPGEYVTTTDAGDYNYLPYQAKPYAMLEALHSGVDIAILLDAAFYPIRPIHILVDHIAQTGYYLCKNGAYVGEWASDEALDVMGFSRDVSLRIEEASSYCVGLNFHHEAARTLAMDWTVYPNAIPGFHTNDCGGRYLPTLGRNIGQVSKDPRVKGHRHDQTVLSLCAHRLGMRELTERPRFTAYLGSEDESTVLVNNGMGS